MRAREFVLEETMPELEYDRSLNYSEERNGVTLRAWIEEAGRLEISASIDGQEVGFTVSPNPTTDNLTINLNNFELNKFYITNSLGNVVYSNNNPNNKKED